MNHALDLPIVETYTHLWHEVVPSHLPFPERLAEQVVSFQSLQHLPGNPDHLDCLEAYEQLNEQTVLDVLPLLSYQRNFFTDLLGNECWWHCQHQQEVITGTQALWFPMLYLCSLLILFGLRGVEAVMAFVCQTNWVKSIQAVGSVCIQGYLAWHHYRAFIRTQQALQQTTLTAGGQLRAAITLLETAVSLDLAEEGDAALLETLRGWEEAFPTDPIDTTATFWSVTWRGITRQLNISLIRWWKLVTSEWHRVMDGVKQRSGIIMWGCMLNTLVTSGRVCRVQRSSELHCTELRHPVYPEVVFPTVELSTSNVVMVTGTHGSGKTTLLRTLGLNVMMAKHYEIAFGAEVLLPDYEDLMTSLELPSVHRDSFFEQESKRCLSWLQSPQERVLVLADELFSGTNPLDAVDGGAAVIRCLRTQRPHITAFITTHFHELRTHVGDSVLWWAMRDHTLHTNAFESARGAYGVFERLGFPSEVLETFFTLQSKENPPCPELPANEP